jgi:hypothetical protein
MKVQARRGRAPDPTLADWLAPEFPACSLEQAKAIRRGKAPREVAKMADSSADFTRAEAHAWLTEAPAESPLRWLCCRAGVPVMRSWVLARWAIRVSADPIEGEALRRERTYPGPAGQIVRARWADKLDEVQDCDLVRGPRTGVSAAFEAAAQRFGAAWLERESRDQRILAPAPSWRLLQGRACSAASWLLTPADLVREGSEMGHCVGGYASAVERGQSSILALDIRGARATIELRPDGSVAQFFGAGDKQPPQVCAKWLRAFLRANKRPEIGDRWGRL